MGTLRYNLLLVVSNVLMGLSFPAYVSLLQGTMQPSQLFVMQLLCSMSIFTPIAISRPNFIRMPLDDFGSIFIVALLVIFGWWYMLINGASYTNPIDASTITTVGPVFTLVTSIIAQSRTSKIGEIIGITIVLLGVSTIIVDRGSVLVSSGGEGYGNTLVMCAVVAVSVNTVLIAPVLRRHGAVVVMGWYYLIGTLLAMPLVVQELPTLSLSDLSPFQFVELLYILLFGSALPMYMLYVGSANLTALHTAVYRYIQPIVATIVATVRGQAIIDRTNIVGAVLIIIGMLCVIKYTPRDEATIRG
ncbi:MAG: DMT family transporter [Alistipes sp.]|nr:DMT family transporter [Alistipes sp.]